MSFRDLWYCLNVYKYENVYLFKHSEYVSLFLFTVVLVFIVVFTCVGIRGSFDEWDAKLGRPFGLLFAVFGGVLLVAVGVTELIQVLCCLNIYTLVWTKQCTSSHDVDIERGT